ncbi:c-type cytochrome [Azospirillum brasilense]|uniref:c-type cytochrome n=1 Tax=Azospirillum brasilense TaxID=192 RepID=UPI0003A57E93|nr:hypothetical protein [Azospirillum brasilense]
MKRMFALLAFGLVASSPGLAAAQDAAAGEKVFNQWPAGKAGSVETYKYSDAMKNAGAWDEATLDAYLADPKGAVPGNKMAASARPATPSRPAAPTASARTCTASSAARRAPSRASSIPTP